MTREFTLGARLSACAGFVRPGSAVADIGTDHALLPIWLVRSGVCPRAVACDINEGPIARARENIARCGLEDKIKTAVADGLAGISAGEASDIVIAGMGGELIASILAPCGWIRDENVHLILQPMSHAERLRAFLGEEGFTLLDEQAVMDGRRVYAVMAAHYTGERVRDDVLEYGGRMIGRTDRASAMYLARTAGALREEAAGRRKRGEEQEAERLEGIAERLLGDKE